MLRIVRIGDKDKQTLECECITQNSPGQQTHQREFSERQKISPEKHDIIFFGHGTQNLYQLIDALLVVQ